MEFEPSRAIWLQLVQEFTGRIVTGRWAPGDRIPGVRELAGELKVNPNTVQRALAELERQGLARTERTAGRFVTSEEAVIDDARLIMAAEAAETYVQRARGLGLTLNSARELLARHWPTGEDS